MRVLVALTSGALMLIAAETGLRIFINHDSRWNLRLGASQEFDPVSQLRNKPNYRFQSGASTNERGYFAAANLPHANPPDRLRIISMGDSVTFLPTAENHPIQLERILTERGFRVERLNVAVPGFASQNVRSFFENEISQYDADIFILSVGWNDLGQFGPEGLPYKRYSAGYQVSRLQQLIANIYLVRVSYALRSFLRRYEPAFDAPLSQEDERLYSEYYPMHYHHNLAAILRLAVERYPLVFVTNLATITSDNPSQDQLDRAHFPIGMDKNMRKLHRLVLRYNEAIERVGRETGVAVIDVYSAFQNDEARGTLRDSCHVNSQGARLIGQTVVDAVESSLPDPSHFSSS